MRSCIYCGRELEAGEKCSCPQSAAHRVKKSSAQNSGASEPNYHNPYKTETTYRTGYSEKQSRFQRARDKSRARRAAKRSENKKSGKKLVTNVFSYIWEFLKSPVDKAASPSNLSKAGIIFISALMGALLWLCLLFVIRGGNPGPFKLLSSLMGFGGAAGYSYLAQLAACILAGAISGILIMLIYVGVFFLIHRFIFRIKTPFWYFSVRLVSAWIPFTAVCLIGTVISLFSPLTLAALMLCGAAAIAVLTYEALRVEWIGIPSGRVLYTMLIGYFIFFSVICCLINI